MSSNAQSGGFWINWLSVVTILVVTFGLVLLLAPSLTRQGFSMLVYASPEHIDAFGQEATRYVSLTHAVIGGVMIGWGLGLFYITWTLLMRGSRSAWNLIALSVGAWYFPDTAYSGLSGFWLSALLNTLFLVLFAVPLWVLRGELRTDA